MTGKRTSARSTLRLRWLPLGIAAALGGTACDTDSLTDLNDPDLITGRIVQDPENVTALRNGVLFEFLNAYAGPASNSSLVDPGIVVHSGLVADELYYASTFDTHREMDARNVRSDNGSLVITFQSIQRARNLAERTAEQYEKSDQKGSADHALVTNLAGFTYVLLGENYCSGVPISRSLLTGEVEYGKPRTTEEILGFAVERFDAAAALAQQAGSNPQLNLARVGKARALLDLGRFTEAAAAASAVPASFRFVTEYSTGPIGNNGVWYFINSAKRMSASTSEGTNGLPYFNRGTTNNDRDPRIPVDSTGFGLGTDIPHYSQGLYTTNGADIPLATGIEAQLIQAEALLNKGQSAAYLPILNSLRATVSLPALTDPGNARARVLQLYSERAFWMYLTAHRLGDLRRLVKYYGFRQEEVFPVGATVFSADVRYGTDVSLPIPFAETNNPEFRGECIDRNA